jgi:Glycosyl transferase 4-like
MSRKILFVAMSSSPHTARWIELIADQGWDLHLFPVYSAKPHSFLKNITIHEPWRELQPLPSWKKLLRNPSSLFSQVSIKQSHQPNEVTIKNIYPLPIVSTLSRVLSHLKSAPLGSRTYVRHWHMDRMFSPV